MHVVCDIRGGHVLSKGDFRNSEELGLVRNITTKTEHGFTFTYKEKHTDMTEPFYSLRFKKLCVIISSTESCDAKS